MESDRRFPKTALLLSVLWLPAAVVVLVLCFAVGWGGMDYWHTQTFVALAVVFLIGAVQAVRTVFVSFRLFATLPPTRTVLNASVLVLGVIMAATLAVLFAGASMAAWSN